MRQNFAVCFGLKLIPHLGQLFSQIQIVLNDPVMHYGDFARGMWMGISIARPSMRRPAGMAYAHAFSWAAKALVDFFQISYSAE